ncbi:hypothetical protein PGT21_037019 [Puccinia graminis f. sp. tritici]|uniref:Uncharacterized protein n=1 Tax=Puccinia graminis f. sp. tritici TaxID=56615 RepID=A0A5B0QRL4_PUCGR|nr:hypothetical protein PGT21_037019 [Puccinia graminis f. sp. tritici]
MVDPSQSQSSQKITAHHPRPYNNIHYPKPNTHRSSPAGCSSLIIPGFTSSSLPSLPIPSSCSSTSTLLITQKTPFCLSLVIFSSTPRRDILNPY